MKQAVDSRKIYRLLGEVELTNHLLGKVLTENRVFCFRYVHSKQIRKKIVIYWIEVFCERISVILETVTSLVRGHGK